MHLYKTQLMLVVEAKTNCMLKEYIHTHERAINLPNAQQAVSAVYCKDRQK